ncbi:MAG: SAM-dependent chlorinase/fluorinase [Bacteroidota bacterium]
MPIVTLTSDFGLADHYVAMIKGALLTQRKDLTIVDISHNIKNYDIVQGAFILKNAYSSFPEGSIHIVSINTDYSPDGCFLAIRHNNHYFIGPDNGIFSLMFGSLKQDMYELDYEVDEDFPIKYLFAKAVGHIFGGMPFNEIGIPVDAIEERITLLAVTTPNQIRGSVIYVDNYENVIVNISQELFERVAQGRNFTITFKRHQPLKKLSDNYSDAPVGETLGFFNSSGLLEIAINMGKASSLLGLQLDDMIQVDFSEKAS